MVSHDPGKAVETLRDHLASHDKPLAFLMGAGTSCAVKDLTGHPLIPGIQALGDRCRAAVSNLGVDHDKAYGAITSQVHDALLEDGLRRDPNIEDILSSVRGKIEAMTATDKLAGVDRAAMEAIEKTIRETIAAEAKPDAAQIPDPLPHRALATWIARIDRRFAVELFTTNYDTLLERGLENARIPVFDGFVGSREPFFEPASLAHEEDAPGRRWSRLWKIHGSINWHRSDRIDGRVVRTDETATGELIFPSLHKYDESRKQPFVAMLQRLAAVLHRREETVLFVLGYAWGDQHINDVIFDALAARERTHVIALQYEELPDDHELIKRAGSRHNLVVYGPKTAVIGGMRRPWRLLEPVDARTADLLDLPFDSDAQPEDVRAVSGRLRLGDFARFTDFLDEMAVNDG